MKTTPRNGLSKDNLLRSWKEISSYLDCGVRTCHRWEEAHGMPVHRVEGGEKRSSVYAFRDELDEWFGRTFKNSSATVEKDRRKSRLKWAAGGIAILAAAGAFYVFRPTPDASQPADFHIDGPFFVVLDKHQRELWRRDMKVDNLISEEEYRKNFQVMNPSEANILPWLIMRDINADGDIEVLFSLQRTGDLFGEGLLACYDRRGGLLWRFRNERELICPQKRFSPDYRINGFDVHDLDMDGRLEIIVESIQTPDWPCQLAVLDFSGKLIGEFWNAGHLKGLAYHDINRDGREELIVGGTNNEYKGGGLIVFDPRDIGGGSPQSGDFACEGIGPGSMLYYVTVPFSDGPRGVGHVVDGILEVRITGNDWIQVTTHTGLIFDFDFDLRCIQVTCSNGYAAVHQEGVRTGRISSVINEDFRKALLDGVRYWDGSLWTPEPSAVRR